MPRDLFEEVFIFVLKHFVKEIMLESILKTHALVRIEGEQSFNKIFEHTSLIARIILGVNDLLTVNEL